MTLPESTVATVKASLENAAAYLGRLFESPIYAYSPTKLANLSRDCLGAVKLLSAPPAMGGLPGLPDRCPTEAVWSGQYGMLYGGSQQKGIEAGYFPIEIHPQGTRDRLGALVEFIEQEAGFDCGNPHPFNKYPCNACPSCRARAILGQGGVGGKA